MRNYGLKFDEIKSEDYIFGGGQVPFEVLQPDGDWSDYLPLKEFQNLYGVEPYACVTFTILNCIETLIKRKYGIERNYSDRFLAAVSGTKEGGNSPQVVCECLRKGGVTLQEVWPFDPSIDTFEKFYSPVPDKLIELAKDFNKEWEFLHDYVPTSPADITKALQSSPLLISVSAWYEQGGIYYRPEGMQDNHATTLFRETINVSRRVFDSYDNPHIKDLRWEDTPMVAKRFWINKRPVVKKSPWWDFIVSFISGIINRK